MGRDPEYTSRVKNRTLRLIKACKWTFPQNVTSDSFGLWRAAQKRFSPKTLNDHLDAVRALLNWMVDRDRIEANPLERVKKMDTQGRQKKRRAFTDEEFDSLLKAANANRRRVYLTAAYTGLRKAELIQMVWGDLQLDHSQPHILARAVTTKDSNDAFIPVHPDLAAQLIDIRPKDAPDNAPVFPQMRDISHAIRRDMKTAGIERIDGMDRKLDFHALRYTFATMLAKQGVSQRTTQELMRHSDPKLTAMIYTDPTQLPIFAAVENLPWVNRCYQSENATHPQIAPQKSDADGHFVSQTDTDPTNDNAPEPVGSEALGRELAQSGVILKWRPHGD